MPRFVRPSWVVVAIDGKAKDFQSGPRSRTGIMTAKFRIREDGIGRGLIIVQLVPDRDGLTTTATILANGEEVYRETFTQ